MRPWLGHDSGMIGLWQRRRPSGSAVDEPSAVDPIRVAVEEASRGGWEAVGHLAALLAEFAATGSVRPGHAALAALTASPRVVVRLDEHARRAWWYEARHASLDEQLLARVAEGVVEAPLAVALASTHGDGRVRERAVAAMLAAPSAELVPFLVLRTSDWARPVRDRARAGLALLLADDPGTFLPALLPAATAIGQRWRGTFAIAQATAALSTASPEVRQALAASADPASRRFVCDLGLSGDWWSADELIGLVESSPDVRIRTRAAEAACRDAVWRRRMAVLHRLARSRRPEVRAVALTGLVRTGNDADVVAYLDDTAPLARALARDAARRTGVDALARYREAVLTAPTPPVIAGFAETASPKEASLLDRLLSHPQAKVRAAALQALRRLDAVNADRIAPMLHDPSAAVVREAVAALLPIVKAVPADLPWKLLADTRAELRRAGYRLLTAGPVRTCLRAGLIATADPHPRIASRARADITRLARAGAASTWRSGPTPDLVITAEEHTDLTALLRRAMPILDSDTVARLASWLNAAARA